MTSQRTAKARVVAHLEGIADRALFLSIPFFAAFMAVALVHAG
jgi:hypothetical protein